MDNEGGSNTNPTSDMSDDEPHRRTIELVEELVDGKKSQPS